MDSPKVRLFLLIAGIVLFNPSCDFPGGDEYADSAIECNYSVEECDGVDNDCDGMVDEDLTQTCQSDCGSGVEICIDGVWQDCDAPQLQTEVCDNQDNDCDGEIDEDCLCYDDITNEFHNNGYTKYCGLDYIGICHPGMQACVNGQWTECQDIKGPEEEICDGLDNDCDGKIDENCPCEVSDDPSCGEDIGECHQGWRYCLNGNWSECRDLVEPQKEICDNKDNDCDGEIDEDLTQDCSNACGFGIEICNQGEWKDCDAPPGEAEVCDNKDNDCDGKTDENLVHSCDLGCGVGTEKCENGKWINCTAKKPEVICKNYTNCKDEVKCSGSCAVAPAEVCDDVDNDCDGLADEDFSDKKQTCTVGVGECKNSGVYVCKANKSSTECSVKAKSAQTEICDNKDNDCDSKTDEDNPDSGGECDVLNQKGECLKGILNCQNGALVCKQTVFSASELCDGLDNNCDGKTDENFSNKGQSCDVGLGECKNTGAYICKADQKDVECSVKAKNSTAETCDNKDNDCDSSTDENLTQACSAICGSGSEKCVSGKWQDCNAQLPKTCMNYGTCKNESMCVIVCPSTPSEVCDNTDNNCDGQVDEGFSLKGNGCTVGIGECQNSGVYVCKADQKDVECSVKAKDSTAEICDNKDNDCDSNADEDFTNLGQTCYVGIGECENSGVYICSVDQKETICSVEAKLSQGEICDNKDNNCDGLTDESLTQTCSTACGFGTETCFGGIWEYCDAPQPQSEYCDNQDNDCDSQTDEDVADCYPVICVNKTSGFPCFSGKCLFNLSGSSYITVSGQDIFSCAVLNFFSLFLTTMNVTFDYKASAGSCYNEPYLYISTWAEDKFFYFPDCYSSGTETISIIFSAVDDLQFDLFSGDWGASVKIKEITFN